MTTSRRRSLPSPEAPARLRHVAPRLALLSALLLAAPAMAWTVSIDDAFCDGSVGDCRYETFVLKTSTQPQMQFNPTNVVSFGVGTHRLHQYMEEIGLFGDDRVGGPISFKRLVAPGRVERETVPDEPEWRRLPRGFQDATNATEAHPLWKRDGAPAEIRVQDLNDHLAVEARSSEWIQLPDSERSAASFDFQPVDPSGKGVQRLLLRGRFRALREAGDPGVRRVKLRATPMLDGDVAYHAPSDGTPPSASVDLAIKIASLDEFAFSKRTQGSNSSSESLSVNSSSSSYGTSEGRGSRTGVSDKQGDDDRSPREVCIDVDRDYDWMFSFELTASRELRGTASAWLNEQRVLLDVVGPCDDEKVAGVMPPSQQDATGSSSGGDPGDAGGSDPGDGSDGADPGSLDDPDAGADAPPAGGDGTGPPGLRDTPGDQMVPDFMGSVAPPASGAGTAAVTNQNLLNAIQGYRPPSQWNAGATMLPTVTAVTTTAPVGFAAGAGPVGATDAAAVVAGSPGANGVVDSPVAQAPPPPAGATETAGVDVSGGADPVSPPPASAGDPGAANPAGGTVAVDLPPGMAGGGGFGTVSLGAGAASGNGGVASDPIQISGPSRGGISLQPGAGPAAGVDVGAGLGAVGSIDVVRPTRPGGAAGAHGGTGAAGLLLAQ